MNKNKQVRSGAQLMKTTSSVLALSTFALFGATLTAAHAQDAAKSDETVVVVKGFRGSLATAISDKKRSNEMIDVVKAEDIGEFPDLNLAESLQRIPGVSIDRDGGEGRQISVRGLNSEFSRTRINGLEALATSAGKDGSAGTNRGRGFDYNVFAADLFNSLTVRKSVSAEVDEGSLGATVDLQTARPFDYKGFAMVGGLQVGYNDISQEPSPRATFMISNRWAGGRLGALLSVAYEKKSVYEQSLTTTRWHNSSSAGASGRFQSYSTNGGSTFTNIPVSGAIADAEANKIVNALVPRIPRYNQYNYDIERLGVTASFQIKPSDFSLITFDGMFAKFGQDREEYEIEAISFSRSGQGLPQTDVYNYTIDSSGVMRKASFNDVDIRSEHRFDDIETNFAQVGMTWDQTWSERLSTKLLLGVSRSDQNNPEQTTFTFESYDVDGYSYDYTDQTKPVFNYGTSSTGCQPNQACYWSYNQSSSSLKGDASLIRLAPNRTVNDFTTKKLDAKFVVSDNLTLKFGMASKTYGFETVQYGRIMPHAPNTRNEFANPLPPSTDAIYNVITNPIQNVINGDIAGYSQSVNVQGVNFLIPNLDKIRSKFDYNCNCINQYGVFTVNNINSSTRGNTRTATEQSDSMYLQLDYNGTVFGMPYRGNIGQRWVKTKLTATGYFALTPTTVTRTYKNNLPSLNFMIEPYENVYVRFAAAKTMARPTLLSLAPGGSFSTSANTITTGNPYLDPTYADTMDLSFEWYPEKNTLMTLAFFRKDIKSYIQRSVVTGSLQDFGFDPASFGETEANATYTLTTPINTPGGKLQGYEIGIQKPFDFLPGFLKNTGFVANYTNVDSEITYILTPSLTAPVTTRNKLLGLSPVAYNFTLYYEDDTFNARVAYAHRDGYISQLVPGSSASFWGKNATNNIDAQVSWNINKNFTLVLEGINLTNEPDSRYISYDLPATGVKVDDLVYEWAESGRQFYLGLRYKY